MGQLGGSYWLQILWLQTLWLQKCHLLLKEEVLYRQWEDVPGKGVLNYLQLVIPKSFIQNVLKESHNAPAGSDFGLRRFAHASTGLANNVMLKTGARPVKRVLPIYHLQNKKGYNAIDQI